MHFFLLRSMVLSGSASILTWFPFGEELHRSLSAQIQVSEEWLVLNMYALREIRVECLVCCVSRNFDFLPVAVSVRGTRPTYLVLFQLGVALPCEKPRK